MADNFKVELVSPERRLASIEASMAQIPGAMGDFAAMPNHAPFLSTLRPGIVTIHDSGSKREFFVTGGFAEISPEGASILAEQAVPRDELDREWLDARIAEAESAAEAAEGADKAATGQRLNDFRAIKGQLGL